jgi:hypothetical protein
MPSTSAATEWRFAVLVDAGVLGERAAVGMAQLSGDDAGRFLVGREGASTRTWIVTCRFVLDR